MKSEYKICLRQLNRENRRLVKKIRWYIDSRHLNGVARQELLGDIAGMALESQKRGEDFYSAIGNDYETFCKELAKNSPRLSPSESLLWMLSWLVAAVGAVLPLMALTEWLFPGLTPAALEGVVLTAPAAYFLKYLVFVGVAVASWFLAFRLTYKSRTLVPLIYVGLMLICLISFELFALWLPESPLWRISLVLWCLIFVALSAVCLVGKHLAALTVAYQQRRREE